MSLKQVYSFTEGNAQMKSTLGGKGANLAEMTRRGLPVPPGFTISTDACLAYFQSGNQITAELEAGIHMALSELEQKTGLVLGNPERPLLVSVRSGSVNSMPGMMDTILNLGLNDETAEALSNLTGKPAFAFDCYRRFIQMFGNVVLGIESHYFESLLIKLKRKHGWSNDQEVTADGWKQLIGDYKQCIKRMAPIDFPQDVKEQLRMAVEAVFRSWNNERAKVYRKIHQIPDSQGTAVNVQIMVFGNKGADCGTGVVFTRNPSTGEKRLFGEYLTNAQGEDVVAGVRTPLPISALADEMPDVYNQLVQSAEQLELHYKDMQDIEFTVEHGKLYLLQTRNGKRNAQAALKIAVDLVKEGILTKEESLQRIEVSHLDQLLHRGLDEDAVTELLGTGLPASPGAAVGQVVFDADTAVEWSQSGKKVILARPETTPEDIHGLLVSEAVITSRGGMTSHAAVVARGMGKPCISGCEEARIVPDDKKFTIGQRTIEEGDWVTVDGASGRFFAGIVPLKEAEMTPELLQMLVWADEVRDLKVYANADNPQDAEIARKFGAEGIGLCRTEHMFFAPERLAVIQRMILADRTEARIEALQELLPMQRSDFEGIFRQMAGLPVTIRLLDPPLHEFLPKLPELEHRLAQIASDAGAAAEETELRRMIRKVHELHESNPMLGHRGCRLGIVYPEIYEMQVEAIFQAAAAVMDEGTSVYPEVMIPLVGHAGELQVLRSLVDDVGQRILGTHKGKCAYKVGTMIEVPRAALTAKQIAPYADFFSFGTNDLTQMTLGYSRDDAEGKFLSHYLDQKLLPHNPFEVLDTEGVGQLVEMAVTNGRAVKPQLKTGICGEHGGDQESIFFCHQIGLDYVSCSPYRIPLARIAAAQASVVHGSRSVEKPLDLQVI
ncbi:pyruvate phosphate dikinase [Cohnella kolymensis]|uniref:Pyruvate, phosphate dikinase n=1 Tax=Cohnella kolymensis TaxID=1590652 RepID=A0ABR5A3R2_9BACL|nr:pyruvate, phosphate dikinase [Cohnella kolymensis]KIL35645.1 pyruvate phosphate dikinase [Cohnella kolymensis]